MAVEARLGAILIGALAAPALCLGTSSPSLQLSFGGEMSADGSAWVLTTLNFEGSPQAGRWTGANGFRWWQPGEPYSFGLRISDDGRTAAGMYISDRYTVAVWSLDFPRVLVTPPGTDSGTMISFIELSANGETALGRASNPVIWTRSAGARFLPLAGAAEGFANVVSGNGQVVFGAIGNPANGYQSVRWVGGGLPQQNVFPEPLGTTMDVSASNWDASVVVGTSNNAWYRVQNGQVFEFPSPPPNSWWTRLCREGNFMVAVSGGGVYEMRGYSRFFWAKDYGVVDVNTWLRAVSLLAPGTTATATSVSVVSQQGANLVVGGQGTFSPTFKGYRAIMPYPIRVTGSVRLQDFVGNPADETVTFEARSVATGQTLFRMPLKLDASGNFVLPLLVPPGTYDITCRGRTWLRQRVATLTVGPSGLTNLNFSLRNGDVNGDGEVNLSDIDLVIARYLSSSNPGDLDGSGDVDLTDIDIAISNYLQADE